MKIFSKEYDGESICDIARDIHDALNGHYNPIVNSIPVDEHQIQRGSFKVEMNWIPDVPMFIYEIHVTVEGDIPGDFRNICSKLGVKPIIIDLEKVAGSIGKEMMTSSKVFNTAEIPHHEAERIKNGLVSAGFKVVRVKIEVATNHPEVPTMFGEVKTPRHKFQHFESHLEIVVNGEEERNELREFVSSNLSDLHFSKNLFKKTEGGKFVQMLTLREYDTVLECFKIRVHEIRQILSEAGFMFYSSPTIEFCIFDSKADHDNDWLK